MTESTVSPIERFLSAASFAVAGASRDRAKYGNKVLRALAASGRRVYPLNPSAAEAANREIEGITAYPSIADLPQVPAALSVVTPPLVTREVIRQAIAAGIQHVWMQPGAEDGPASEAAREAGLNVIDDGSCLLVALAVEGRDQAGRTPDAS